jgi:hypothetical protein
VVEPGAPAKVNPANGLVTPPGGFDDSSLRILDPTNKQWVNSYSDSSGTYTVVDGRVVFDPAPGVSGDVSMKSFVFKIADNSGNEYTGKHSMLIGALEDLPEDLGPVVAKESEESLVFKPGSNIRIRPNEVFESYAGETFDVSTFGFSTPNGIVNRLETPQGVWVIDGGVARFTPVPGFRGYVRTDVSIVDSNGVRRSNSLSVFVGTIPAPGLPVTGTYSGEIFAVSYLFLLLGALFVVINRGRWRRVQ